jgi:hypothetical protein
VTIKKREWYFHKKQICIWDIGPVKQNREPRNKNIRSWSLTMVPRKLLETGNLFNKRQWENDTCIEFLCIRVKLDPYTQINSKLITELLNSWQ